MIQPLDTNAAPGSGDESLPFRVLLYYNFVPVSDPEALREEMESVCADLGLLGRILIAHEGINGTVSGPVAATTAYIEYVRAHPVLHATEFKIDAVEGHTFNKLHVRVKQEIVHLGVEELDVHQPVSNYVEPDEFRAVLESDDPDVVILDARSNYEHEVGRFRNALTLDIENFRELPERLAELEAYKDKKIYTYCTGGIKCEKVSRLMLNAGFSEVYQLHGGIIRYAHEQGGAHFDGSCYVFDQRVVVPVNEVDPRVVGKCRLCGGPTEKMINCGNPDCNDHFLICEQCADTMEGTCSEACRAHPRRRMWDGRGYYLRGVNSKLYQENPDPNYLAKMKQEQESL